jgi:hypothetical protein
MSVSYPSSIYPLLYIQSTSSRISECFPLSPVEQFFCRLMMYSRPQTPLPNALRKTFWWMVLFYQIRPTCQSLPCTNFWRQQHDTRFCQDLCKINKLEHATRDNLDWSEFGYRERMTRLQCQAKDLSVQRVDHKQDRAESNQSKLGNKSVTWIKHKK